MHVHVFVTQECRDLEPRASYLYLRGMFLAAKGEPREALEDLYSLSSINARLLATELVSLCSCHLLSLDAMPYNNKGERDVAQR